MRLKLYSSRRGQTSPHLVAIQSADLDMLATVLVCPLRNDVPLTGVRAAVKVGAERFVVMCDLARPIHRRALVEVGDLNDEDSVRVMLIFGLLLAR